MAFNKKWQYLVDKCCPCCGHPLLLRKRDQFDIYVCDNPELVYGTLCSFQISEASLIKILLDDTHIMWRCLTDQQYERASAIRDAVDELRVYEGKK